MGMHWFVLFAVFCTMVIFALQENVHAESLSWKSEYAVGYLKPEPSEFNIKISTLDKDSLKVEWSKSQTLKNVEGYQIMRKTENSDYKLVAEQNSKTRSYSDTGLKKGYYTYMILPIINDQVDKPTKHGISRTSDLFKSYVKGQELIAKQRLKDNCPKCYDESFAEIDQIFAHDFPNGERFTPKLKTIIEKEALKANIRFNELYDMMAER